MRSQRGGEDRIAGRRFWAEGATRRPQPCDHCRVAIVVGALERVDVGERRALVVVDGRVEQQLLHPRATRDAETQHVIR
jgi:hypothetical protein